MLTTSFCHTMFLGLSVALRQEETPGWAEMPLLKGMAFPLPAAHPIAAATMHEAQMLVHCSSARAALP